MTAENKQATLTKRERDIVKWSVAGKSADVTAEIIGVSVNTVRSTRYKLFKKFDVVSMPQLVAKCFRLGILS